MKLIDQPSAWDDPASDAIEEIVDHYNRGVPRADLASVRRLLARFAPARPLHHVVVVGTNGKTSTATLLARLLAARGIAVGLYTSPHIARWSERVRIDGISVSDDSLLATLTAIDRLAVQDRGVSPDLRFFDLLTLAAEDLFGRAGVEVAVFEAGIGGRLDATRVLAPELVALTSIGDDHRELLGFTPQEILSEKLAVAGKGSTLVIGHLDPGLAAQARAWAAEAGVELAEVGAPDPSPAELPRFQRRNLALARRTAELADSLLGLSRAGEITDFGVYGRFEQGQVDGVSYVADVAHNQTAWQELLLELERSSPERRWLAVVAVTAERRPEELAAALAGAATVAYVVATVTPVRAARDPSQIVAALNSDRDGPAAEVCEPAASAFDRGASLARRYGLDLLVTGSNYLVSEFLAWLANRTER